MAALEQGLEHYGLTVSIDVQPGRRVSGREGMEPRRASICEAGLVGQGRSGPKLNPASSGGVTDTEARRLPADLDLDSGDVADDLVDIRRRPSRAIPAREHAHPFRPT
ncbi:MAG: hypothetical protein ABR529_15790 [Actinomycetota bacterium]